MCNSTNDIIRLENISKSFDSNLILKDISLSIKEGEFVFIIGKSGSGKSTLLNILALFENFDSGNYFLENNSVLKSKKNYPEIRNKYFGFVFQAYHLIDGLNVLDNIKMPLLYSSHALPNAEEKVLKIANELDISKILYRRINELSGGEKQRVAFARAIINDPKIIFCDEPTGNLDEENSRIIMNLLYKENKNGKTIIVVTHDNNFIKKSESTIYEIKDKNFCKLH